MLCRLLGLTSESQAALLARGRYVDNRDDSDPTGLTDDEVESMALHWRAETGLIPYRIWVSLTDAAKRRLESLSQTGAQRRIASQVSITETMPIVLPPSSHPIDELALEPHRKRSK